MVPVAILVLPVFYQNLPVSAILVQILVNTNIIHLLVLQILENSGRYWDTINILPLVEGVTVDYHKKKKYHSRRSRG
jgi:hypothetical protein